jgi:serine/threonine protein kinase
MREARLASRLYHPSLVRVYDITELDRLPTIVMELVPGGTLEHGRLTEPQAADVADALAHAHREGVIHRDLKPANLLLGPDSSVKIADFGIARAVEETMVTQVGTVLGTLRYLSPEQAAGDPVGPEADVYSLGVVLDELLPTKRPEVRRLLAQCRERDPRRRPTAAEVAAVLRGDTLAAPTRVLRPRHLRTPRLAYGLALGAAGAAAAAIAVAATSNGTSTPPPVSPVPRSSDPGQQARNLAAWLEKYSR